jgi:hypothetical protein
VQESGVTPKQLDSWFAPFVLVLCLPLLTVPATIKFLSMLDPTCLSPTPAKFVEQQCSDLQTLATLAPGLLGFLSLIWLRSQRSEVKGAALISSLFVLARILAPSMARLAHGSDEGVFGIFGTYIFVISPLLWVATFVVCVAYGAEVRAKQLRVSLDATNSVQPPRSG